MNILNEERKYRIWLLYFILKDCFYLSVLFFWYRKNMYFKVLDILCFLGKYEGIKCMLNNVEYWKL